MPRFDQGVFDKTQTILDSFRDIPVTLPHDIPAKRLEHETQFTELARVTAGQNQVSGG